MNETNQVSFKPKTNREKRIWRDGYAAGEQANLETLRHAEAFAKDAADELVREKVKFNDSLLKEKLKLFSSAAQSMQCISQTVFELVKQGQKE